MSRKFAVSFLALAAGLATSVPAQSPGSSFFASPAIGNAVAGFAFSMTGAVPSTIDGAAEVVGTTLASLDPVSVTDTIVDNGGGNFVVTIRIDSIGDVAPTGFTLGGLPADTAGVFIGANAGGPPVDFANAALVNSASISVLDLAGVPLVTFDITAVASFADPLFGGGWNGSLGLTFGAGSVGGIGGYELIVDYDEGVLLGKFTTSGAGCPAGAPVSLSADSAPTIGASTTITASSLPAGTIAATLLFGIPPGVPLPLDGLGATGCSLLVNAIFIDVGMPVVGTDATLLISVPNDPATIGLALDVQAAAAAPGANPAGLVMSDLGSILVGG